jgi:hypothetical protein
MEKRMKNAFLISTCLIVSLFSLTKAAWTPPAASAWKSLSNNLGVSMKATNATVAPVGVDRTTGWLIVQPWANGVWRSTNQGQNFTHIDNKFTGDHGVWSSMGVTVCPDDGNKISIWAQYNGPGNTGFTVDGGTTCTCLVPCSRRAAILTTAPSTGTTTAKSCSARRMKGMACRSVVTAEKHG